jgi:hypothetical protein
MAKQQKPTEAIEKRGETAVAAFDYGEDAGRGFEGQSGEDLSIPFIVVLQALSPQVSGDQKVKGAEAGMLFNTVTEQLYSGEEGIVAVPSLTQHLYTEWVPRDAGGGFVGIHPIDADVVKKAKAAAESFGKYSTEEGNQLVETFQVYWTILDKDGDPAEQAVMAFTSAKIKAYKKWNTRLKMFQVAAPNGAKVMPPIFAHSVRITTEHQKNSKGSFYIAALDPAVESDMTKSLLPPDHAAFLAAKSFGKLIRDGAAAANYEASAKAGDGKDAEVPF